MLVLLTLVMAGVQAGVYNEYSREDLLRYREEVREMFQVVLSRIEKFNQN